MEVTPLPAGTCASAQGESLAQGAVILSGSDPFNLSVAAVGLVTHPVFNLTLPGVPPPYGVYPSTAFEFQGVRWLGYYLLSDPSGPCQNWCHLGPLLGFAYSPASAPANGTIPDAWSYEGVPLWGGAGESRGVFEPITASAPIRMGVPRFADLGVNLQYSPDGRAYLIAKGCFSNDGLSCSFMTGDSAYLARTVLPMADLVGNPALLNNASSWEFFGGAGAPWVPALSAAVPLFVWPSTVGGLTLTYLPSRAKFIIVCNLPSDHIRPTDKSFDTYVLEASSIEGPYALISYMERCVVLTGLPWVVIPSTRHDLTMQSWTTNVLSANQLCILEWHDRYHVFEWELGCQPGFEPSWRTLWSGYDRVYTRRVGLALY